jgi:hypothetical protein
MDDGNLNILEGLSHALRCSSDAAVRSYMLTGMIEVAMNTLCDRNGNSIYDVLSSKSRVPLCEDCDFEYRCGGLYNTWITNTDSGSRQFNTAFGKLLYTATPKD